MQKRHVAEQAVLQPLHGITVQVDTPQPERVPERGRVQHVDVVVGQVQIDEDQQAAERVLVDRLDGTAAGFQLVKVDQVHGLERVLGQLQHGVVGHVEHLHVLAQVRGYAGQAGVRAVGLSQAAHPFAPAQLRVALDSPIRAGRRAAHHNGRQQQYGRDDKWCMRTGHCLSCITHLQSSTEKKNEP